MIITKIHQGLGNQMFQYAAGRALALHHGEPLKLDLLWFSHNRERRYGLSKFAIQAVPANMFEILSLRGVRIQDWKGGWPGELTSSHYAERVPQFNPDVLELGSNTYLRGYFQSPKYFERYGDVIRNELRPLARLGARAEEVNRQIELEIESVSLHVRRTDYTSSSLAQFVLPLSFYREALAILRQRLTHPHFYLFSDDPDWVEKNLAMDDPFTVVSRGALKDYEELSLMSRCKHHIIANSSFSWWGAWLNPDANKMVIAPKLWQRNWTEEQSAELLPPSWLRI